MTHKTMWTCKICDSEVEDDSWDQCWKCSSPRDIGAQESEALRVQHQTRMDRYSKCLRCETEMKYAGTKSFHEGARLGFWLGNLGELFVGREGYDVYYCPECGKVEFYIEGIGGEVRGKSMTCLQEADGDEIQFPSATPRVMS